LKEELVDCAEYLSMSNELKPDQDAALD
jgi:hypothetical protein